MERIYFKGEAIDYETISGLLNKLLLPNYDMTENPILINGRRYDPANLHPIKIDFYHNPDDEDNQNEIMITVDANASDHRRDLALRIRKKLEDTYGSEVIHPKSFEGQQMLNTYNNEIDYLYKPAPRPFVEFWQQSNIAEMLKVRDQNKQDPIVRMYREVD